MKILRVGGLHVHWISIERLVLFVEKRNKTIFLAVWAGTIVFTLAFAFGVVPTERIASWGYLGLFFLNVLSGATLILAGPGQLATLVAGSHFNPLLVGLVGGLGTSLGETTGYGLGLSAQAAASDAWRLRLERFKASWLYRLFLRRPTGVLFLVALIPNPVFDILSLAAGAMRFPFLRYFLPVLIGKTARFIFIAYLIQIIAYFGQLFL